MSGPVASVEAPVPATTSAVSDRAEALTARAPSHPGGLHLLLFPVLLNAWPLLLMISQKALVPLGLLLGASGTPAYRKDLGVAAVMLLAAGGGFALQTPNEFAAPHLIGYALFILAVPLVNLAARHDADRLLHLLALFSVANALLALLVYALSIDLSGYRGLNRIVGDDDATHRVYFESTCLIAVFSVRGIRTRWRRVTATLLVLANALLLAKSVFVVTLYALNQLVPVVLRGSARQRLAALVFGSGLLVLGLLTVLALRPDVALSLGIKFFQFDYIQEYTTSTWWGAGWGYVIDEIINSETQPYQVEMQLPMLLSQIGIVGVAIYASGMWLLVRSASASTGVAWLRWLAYLAIGFNNPWLFLPSWYLTSILLFRPLESPR